MSKKDRTPNDKRSDVFNPTSKDFEKDQQNRKWQEKNPDPTPPQPPKKKED